MQENMTKALSQVPLCLLVACCATGCASSMIHDRVEALERTSHEFRVLDESTRTYMGARLQSKNASRAQHEIYAFKNVLLGGPGRVLLIHAPQESGQLALVTDVQTNLVQTADLNLVVVQLPRTYNTTSDFYIKQHLPEVWDSPDRGRTLILKQDPLTAINGKEAWSLAVPAADPDFARTRWNIYDVDLRLQHVARDADRIARLKAAYFVTVPIDIVTFPVQAVAGFIGMILYVEHGEGRL